MISSGIYCTIYSIIIKKYYLVCVIMFSFFGRQSTKTPLSLIQLINLLQQAEVNLEQARAEITSFARDARSQHHNTLLLLALAWNHLRAASRLLDLDTHRVALNLADGWPTCQNTPLILAAKINAESIIQQLVACRADLDRQDYRGYTALHYASLYRNSAAITRLLDAGASAYVRDAFGKLPQDYYAMQIKPADLCYRYGEAGGELFSVSDDNNYYFATKNKKFSALRWYIAHWVVNTGYGSDIIINDHSLLAWAQYALKIRSPIYNATLYKAMMKLFCDRRPSLDADLLSRLQQVCGKLNPYIEATFNNYYLPVTELVPGSNISVINNEVWIELEERHSAASPSSPEIPAHASIGHP